MGFLEFKDIRMLRALHQDLSCQIVLDAAKLSANKAGIQIMVSYADQAFWMASQRQPIRKFKSIDGAFKVLQKLGVKEAKLVVKSVKDEDLQIKRESPIALCR